MVKTIKPISRICKIEAEINRIAGEVFVQKKRGSNGGINGKKKR